LWNETLLYLYTKLRHKVLTETKKNHKMKNWINTLIEEKGLNIHTTIDVEGKSGLNIIPLGVVVEHILIAPQHEQNQIKNTLVKIDFHNGDVMHFLTFLAKAIAR